MASTSRVSRVPRNSSHEPTRASCAARVAAEGALGKRGALDARAWYAEAVREVPQGAGDASPAAAHRAAAHARLAPVRRLLVDDQIERHDLGHQIRERAERLVTGVRQPLGKRELELAIHGRRAEGHIFDRLDEDAAALRPGVHAVAEPI